MENTYKQITHSKGKEISISPPPPFPVHSANVYGMDSMFWATEHTSE